MTGIIESRRREARDDLAKRQWNEWAVSRRHLIQAGAFALAGGALAN
jgi:hypothetical protein